MKPVLGRVVCVLLFLPLFGCKQQMTEIPDVDGIHGVWRAMFRPYGVYPLYPVRTAVQPGDVYVLCTRATSASADASSSTAVVQSDAPAAQEWVRLFSLSYIDREFEKYAKTRMAYGSVVVATAAASAPLGPASSASPYLTNQIGSSIGFASFPSVLSYTQNRTDFGVGTVAGVAAIGAGWSSASQSAYVLEIPSAEYAELPLDSLSGALRDTAAKLATDSTSVLHDLLKQTKLALDSKRCVPESLSVVGTVYYTRHMTVSLGDSYANALSARVAYELPGDSTRKAVFDAIGSYAAGASAPAAAASTSFPSSDQRIAKLIIDIDKIYKAADDNSKVGFTGVKVGYARGKGNSVSMDYAYSVPVAFGMKLFSIPLVTDAAGTVGLGSSIGPRGSLLSSNSAPPVSPTAAPPVTPTATPSK